MNINEIPKIELHCHLDGSIRPETILELAITEGLRPESTTLTNFIKEVRAPKDCHSLIEYLERFALPIQIMQSSANIKRIIRELLEDCSKEHIKYIEIRFAPMLHTQNGLSIESVIESAITGIEEGFEAFGVHANLILCCMRHMSIEENLQMVESAKPYKGKGVVAIDLAGNEKDFPPELFIDVFSKVKDYGFHITIHAGETGDAENIRKSIELLHAERIGHGIDAYRSPEVYDMIKTAKVPLEMCLTSNVQTKATESYAQHPFSKYYKDGLFVTVNTDNRTVSDTTSTKEFEIIDDVFDLDMSDYLRIYKTSVEASFASSQLKEKLLADL